MWRKGTGTTDKIQSHIGYIIKVELVKMFIMENKVLFASWSMNQENRRNTTLPDTG